MLKYYMMVAQARHSVAQEKHFNKKPILIIASIIVIIAAIFLVSKVFRCSQLLPAGQTAEITVTEGMGANEVANQMEKANLVASANDVVKIIKDRDAASQIKCGTYLFEGGKSPDEYVSILIKGPDASSPRVVVTEGMKLKDICQAVEEGTKSRIKASEFSEITKDASRYSKDYDFLKDAGNHSLEGFLYPKTYSISNTDKAEDIVRMMLDQFKEETKDLNMGYPSSRNLNLYDVITLASIVEKESIPGVEGKVASVFYNRLKINMPLNSDATTAYEVGHNPTPEEVHSNSPYSTYTNYGLPPTPICSPGIDCIRAVCNPEETDYMYFFFKGDKYAFSKTFEEHQDAILAL